MSENVASSGFFAVLKNPIDKNNLSKQKEILYDKDSNLSINNEGTLVFSDNRGKEYGLNIGSIEDQDTMPFINECNKHNLEIDEKTIRPYNCIWYNGCDSDMYYLTLEEYKKHLD